MAVVVNKLIPEFEALATNQVKVSNTSHVGQTIVLYFYPKDNTPGCTTEAMQFRDKYKDFVKAGALVFGVSRDNMKSHEEFKSKLELPFELIADTEEKMCHMFGVVKNKIMYGKKVKGIERSTFLIGTDGKLAQEWRGLKVPGHVEEVLKAVKDLKKATTPAAKPAAKPAAEPTAVASKPAPAAKAAPAAKVAVSAKATSTKAAADKPAAKPTAKAAAKSTPATKTAAKASAAKTKAVEVVAVAPAKPTAAAKTAPARKSASKAPVAVD
jgi:thioredoxin-dependent peroxiredoxin